VHQHHLAGWRQHDARRTLVHQLAAEELLEPLDLGADGGLRDAEQLRGAGEAAHVDDRDEGAQELRRDIGHLSPMPGLHRAHMQ
jgi:hypothetical protein